MPLTATAEISTRLHAHPNGVSACEVEIDAETGAQRVTLHLSVDDVGRAINPMIVEGQLHGVQRRASAKRSKRSCTTVTQANPNRVVS